MFDSLSGKLQDTLQQIRGQDKITEANIDQSLEAIRRQLLEADVSLKAVKLFINRVRKEALEEKVLRGLKPGEQFVKIVYEALVERLGGDASDKHRKVPLAQSIGLSPRKDFATSDSASQSILLLGLQGAGKTTAAAKLAYNLKKEGAKPLLVPCDLQRPAAVRQLQILAEQAEVDFLNIFADGDDYKVKSPLELSKLAKEQASQNENDILIFDTAGRLQIDTDLMAELLLLEKQVAASAKLLVIDSLIGQEAANVADSFNTQIGITGVLMSKMDADTRGGAALSVVEATGQPIKLASTGEKLEDLEIFYPDRIASRLLGMGDVLTLVEQAEEKIAEEESKRLEAELMKGNFNYETFMGFQNMISKLGDFGQIFNMMGMGNMLSQFGLKSSDQASVMSQSQSKMAKFKIIINSMTPQERKEVNLVSQDPSAESRRARILRGCGLDQSDLEQLVKEFEQMSKTFKQIAPMMSMMQQGGGQMDPRQLMGQAASASMSKKQAKAMKAQGMLPGKAKNSSKKAKKGAKPSIKGFRT
ncbi:MAG: signal recognition particle receptor subunit alpha [Candidatus Melainabacteria bacterium]|nr:signal recognition particle receptor subunit alpha [Candidatus Melainabacteria bacterium]